jgi:hypothetical protein
MRKSPNMRRNSLLVLCLNLSLGLAELGGVQHGWIPIYMNCLPSNILSGLHRG